MIVTMTKNRMDKLNQFGGGPIPIRVKGAGKSGEFAAVMMPKNSGGMLSAAGMRGGMLSATGTQRGGTSWLNVAKKASAVASPLAMLAGPEMLPVSAGLAAFAGSGKKKKGVDLAAQIGSIIAEPQGQNKEAGAMQRVGKVVANRGGGKKTKKVKKPIGDLSQIAALLGQTSGYMTPQQAALTRGIGSLIQGSGLQDLTGDVFHPPQAALPPRQHGARPKIAVKGGTHTKKKASFRSRIESAYEKLALVVMKLLGKKTTTDNFELMQAGKQLLGDKFAGVYSSDQRPALSKKKPYAILNRKPASSGGEDWIAACMPSTGKIMHYDSFGRSHRKLFPDRWEDEAIDTELDVEQDEQTTGCGQRSLAWLLLFDQLGSSAAKMI